MLMVPDFTPILRLQAEYRYRRDAGAPGCANGSLGRFLVHQTKRGFFWSTYQYQWPSTSFHALGIGTFSGVP